MYFTQAVSLRRILNSSYHPFQVIPKPAIWPKRERLKRLTAVSDPKIKYKAKNFAGPDFSGNMDRIC
jgi:hypothetical protein